MCQRFRSMIENEVKLRAELALLSEPEKIDLIIDLMKQVRQVPNPDEIKIYEPERCVCGQGLHDVPIDHGECRPSEMLCAHSCLTPHRCIWMKPVHE